MRPPPVAARASRPNPARPPKHRREERTLTLTLTARSKKTVEKKSAGKKKLSGYMKFSQERRPGLKTEQPDLTFGEIGKALGAEWKALSEADKAKYK